MRISKDGYADHCLQTHLFVIRISSSSKMLWMFSWVSTAQRYSLGLWLFQSRYSKYLYPIGSMYGIFTYIYHTIQPNVGRYTSPWILWVLFYEGSSPGSYTVPRIKFTSLQHGEAKSLPYLWGSEVDSTLLPADFQLVATSPCSKKSGSPEQVPGE